MSDIISMLSKNLEKYRHLKPAEFKNFLLKSKAAAQCMQDNAHENRDDLRQIGDTMRQASTMLPAVGIALTMHNHIVLSCRKFPSVFKNTQHMLNEVKQSRALVASAFAEGIPGASVLAPNLQLEAKKERLFINGAKKPCSLASIADYFVLSAKDDHDNMRMLLLSRETHDVQALPYWNIDVLIECDNQELRLNNTEISMHDVSQFDEDEQQKVISYGLCTFNYFAANAYCGVLEGLLNQIPSKVAESPSISYALVQARSKAEVLLEQMLEITTNSTGDMMSISKILTLRYIMENIIEDTAKLALRCCGGIQSVSNPDIFYFHTVAQLYKFHPISEFQYINSLKDIA